MQTIVVGSQPRRSEVRLKGNAMKNLFVGLCVVAMVGVSHAALPPPSEEAAKAAALKKLQAAHGAKVGGYKNCLAQNKVASKYKKPGTEAAAACADPGPFKPPV